MARQETFLAEGEGRGEGGFYARKSHSWLEGGRGGGGGGHAGKVHTIRGKGERVYAGKRQTWLGRRMVRFGLVHRCRCSEGLSSAGNQQFINVRVW